MSSNEDVIAGSTVVDSANSNSPGNSTDGQIDSDELYEDDELIDKMIDKCDSFRTMVKELKNQKRPNNQPISHAEIEKFNRQISNQQKLTERIWASWYPDQLIVCSDETLEDVGVTVEHVLKKMVNRSGIIIGLVAHLQNIHPKRDSEEIIAKETFGKIIANINELKSMAEKLKSASGQPSSSRYMKKKHKQESLLNKLLRKTVKC